MDSVEADNSSVIQIISDKERPSFITMVFLFSVQTCRFVYAGGRYMNNALRVKNQKGFFFLGLSVLFVAGCAGTSGAGDLGLPGHYQADVGLATAFDLRDKTRRVLDKYQFEVLRFDQNADMIYYETQWKDRYPFQDEVDQGIEGTRTRIIIQGKPRTRRKNQSDVFSVKFSAESQVRLKETSDWHYALISPMAKIYLKQLADDLETEYRSGLRRF